MQYQKYHMAAFPNTWLHRQGSPAVVQVCTERFRTHRFQLLRCCSGVVAYSHQNYVICNDTGARAGKS